MKVLNLNQLKIEFLLLFIISPIAFALKLPMGLKLGIGLVGFVYMVRLLIVHKYSFLLFSAQSFKNQALRITALFLGLILLTTTYVCYYHPEKLFSVVLQKPLLWFTFLFVYSIVSVIPQEIIYRSFYFLRYRNFLKNEQLFLLLNALVFSLGHLFFNNPIVLALSFIGGYIFAYTYIKTKSLIFVCLEHMLYGCWLFTVGMGDILGFPS
ncbi:CPBP family intramembrane glutamic endopeptidase [Flavicella sediminum]|uniref:CPBP family intramembrane glutamic endopeptidase n=1 Tax=Flavicella sediminum TaxID=2585141 RepID=UPI0011238D31|nr:CPBP family intramembrane glutamic endopeptidase [Flavicella sediminum]